MYNVAFSVTLVLESLVVWEIYLIFNFLMDEGVQQRHKCLGSKKIVMQPLHGVEKFLS